MLAVGLEFYAKIKGWELSTGSGEIYWSGNQEEINDLWIDFKKNALKLNKKEWSKLGINDSNADFERVEE